jgi:hypothetical protein
MLALAWLALNILCVFLCHFLAKRRGAKPVFWGFMGFLFGPLAIPFVLLARPEHY